MGHWDMHSAPPFARGVAHIASEFTCVYCATAETIFGTTGVNELSLSYLSISIFKMKYRFKNGITRLPLLSVSTHPSLLNHDINFGK